VTDCPLFTAIRTSFASNRVALAFFRALMEANGAVKGAFGTPVVSSGVLKTSNRVPFDAKWTLFAAIRTLIAANRVLMAAF
jgi:hypothetical protein